MTQTLDSGSRWAAGETDLSMLVGGEWVDAANGARMTSVNPATEEAGGMLSDAQTVGNEIEYYAGIASETKGFTSPQLPDGLTFTERSPYGVVARIIPFNHPFKFAAGKIAAPLAAGNAVILKPAEQTSLSALEMGRIAADVFPPGVVSILTGAGGGVGSTLVAHPGVPRVAFTRVGSDRSHDHAHGGGPDQARDTRAGREEPADRVPRHRSA